MKNLIISFLCILILSSCKQDNQFDSLFSTKKRSLNSLKKIGYSRVMGVDLLIYSKTVNDTIIDLAIDEKTGVINTKTWKILLEKNSFDIVYNLFMDKNTFFKAPRSFYEGEKSYYFTVVRKVDNNVYFCKVLEENGKDYLYVTYHVPRSRGAD